jgi:uncharacterized lipoprotein YmbA
MIDNLFFQLSVITLGVSLMVVGGCASTEPSRFYILNSLPSSGAETSVLAPGDSAAIGVGPIEFPKYLDRPQIVTRRSKNELHLAEFDQWLEPLSHNFSRVLTKNLSILLSNNRIIAYPWAGSAQIAYQVPVEVIRFDGTPGDNVVLNVCWSVIAENGNKVLVNKMSSFSQSTGVQSYEALVAAKSQVLANLSQEIAGEVNRLLQDLTAQ